MNRKMVVCLVAATLLSAASFVEAQQVNKVPRIGYLTIASTSAISARAEAFRQGLRELGYVEGKNLVIDWRFAEYKLERLPALATELVNLKVDIIVTGGRGATRHAKNATASIPIVMTQDTDPVADGFVTSLARPGANITGLSTLAPELSGKRLELLREIVPKLSRVAVFGATTNLSDVQASKEIARAAGAGGIKLQYLKVPAPKDIESAFRAATKERADAVLMLDRVVFNSNRSRVVALAIKHRLPVIYSGSSYVTAGGLMSYAPNILENDRRAAAYVDKILKGAKPADLPVEQPTKFEFIINLKAAKQIGLIIPPNVLARADKVIK
jgi:putative ABC transport system substrate-binding protein